MKQPPTISLVCATIGRTQELLPLLHSLENQTFGSFELIVVDQNPTRALLNVLAPYQEKITIHYHKIDKKGAASSRNYGIAQAKGKFIAFPDDDCYYAPDTLQKVITAFDNQSECACFSIKYCDIDSSNAMQGLQKTQAINLQNVISLTAMITIFASTQAVKKIGGFDENLDYGNSKAVAQAFEDFELIMNLINHNFKIMYLNDIVVYHKIPPAVNIQITHERAKFRIVEGGAAQVYVAKKHYGCLRVAKLFAFHFLAIFYNMLKLNSSKIHFHWLILKGMKRVVFVKTGVQKR